MTSIWVFPLSSKGLESKSFALVRDQVLHKLKRMEEKNIVESRKGSSHQVGGSSYSNACNDYFLLPKSLCDEIDAAISNFW